MGLGGILVLLLVLVSLIVFIYFIVVTARTWGVLHTILLCILFIECWVFFIFAAGVQNRRVHFTAEAAQAEQRAVAAEQETNRLLYGTLDATAGSLDAVVPVKGRLRRMTIDRGRVWRELIFVQSQDGEYQLEMATPEAVAEPLVDDADGGPQAAAPNAESLPEDLVVYGFAEVYSEEGHPRPVFYLGEFIVTESQGGSVQLRPTLPLSERQRQRIESGGADTWMLYELLPVDSHLAFAVEGSEPSDEAIFGRMDEEVLQQMFAEIPNDDGRREAVISSYLRDGQRADADDETASVWVEVNMLEPHAVDVDSLEEANATVGGYFDSIGRSVDVRLKNIDNEEGTVELTPDMTSERIVLKEEVALELRDAGKVEFVQRIYVRPLNDYEDAFSNLFVRQHEVQERITLVKRDSNEIEKANAQGTGMISFRQVEFQKLDSDLSNFQREVEFLENAVEEADSDLSGLKSQMSELYRSIQRQHRELQQGTLQLTKTQ